MESEGNGQRLSGKLVFLIVFCGLLSIALLIKSSTSITIDVAINLLVLTLLYLITFQWSVTLPSGAKFRPAIAFVLLGFLTNPFVLAIFIPIPAVFIMNIKYKRNWWEFFLTIGHLSLGVYAGGLIYQLLVPSNHFSLPSAYPAIILALIAHFLVNRCIAAIIVAYRKNNRFIDQCRQIKNDINWTYLGVYLLSIQMLFIYRDYLYWGLFISVFLLITLYQSVNYFSRYKVVSKKAFTDALTGAENRAAWELFIEEVNDRQVLGSIMMIDLDNFKEINDLYGHQYGDDMLKEFVHYLKDTIAKKHRIFRYGGDEFLIYICHDQSEYQAVYEEVNSHLAQLNSMWEGKNLSVSISSGMTQLFEKRDVKDIINKVDQLMYSEKRLKKQLVH